MLLGRIVTLRQVRGFMKWRMRVRWGNFSRAIHSQSCEVFCSSEALHDQPAWNSSIPKAKKCSEIFGERTRYYMEVWTLKA